MISTENALDLAIEGPGFFQIVQPDGTIAYTRDGGFKLSQEGELVTPQGLLLQPQIVILQKPLQFRLVMMELSVPSLRMVAAISSLAKSRLPDLLTQLA